MPKPDDVIAEVGPFTIFRKSDSTEYEVVGPAVDHSPLSYTMIRTTPALLQKVLREIKSDSRRVGKK